jgi:alcohol dehydrogenase
VYDKVTPDPTVPQIIAGADLFNAEKCDGIIAFGGGSSIDCAKVVGARAVKGRSIESFAGTLQVEPSALVFGSSLPPLIAVPTTAGTGSEGHYLLILFDVFTLTLGAIVQQHLALSFGMQKRSLFVDFVNYSGLVAERSTPSHSLYLRKSSTQS